MQTFTVMLHFLHFLSWFQSPGPRHDCRNCLANCVAQTQLSAFIVVVLLLGIFQHNEQRSGASFETLEGLHGGSVDVQTNSHTHTHTHTYIYINFYTHTYIYLYLYIHYTHEAGQPNQNWERPHKPTCAIKLCIYVGLQAHIHITSDISFIGGPPVLALAAANIG